MLVLTRVRDESIIISTSEGRIEVMVTDVKHNGRVRLGITAPKSVTVNRKEVQEQIDKETKHGASTNMSSSTS